MYFGLILWKNCTALLFIDLKKSSTTIIDTRCQNDLSAFNQLKDIGQIPTLSFDFVKVWENYVQFIHQCQGKITFYFELGLNTLNDDPRISLDLILTFQLVDMLSWLFHHSTILGKFLWYLLLKIVLSLEHQGVLSKLST